MNSTSTFQEVAAKKFARGLSEIEVAVIKRMKLLGLQRDYIFSFVAEPGRVISPACVDEAASGKIGREVQPASEEVVREFVRQRVMLAASATDFDDPLSAWRIHQALESTRANQLHLAFEEGYGVEFKQLWQTTDESIAKYMKGMCAFANASGGYLFFGIADAGSHSTIDIARFANSDWESLDQKLEATFQPYFKWEKRVATLPDDEFLLGSDSRALDTTLIRRLATRMGVEASQLDWLDRLGERSPRRADVGVIYVWPAPARVTCIRSYKRILKANVSYARYRKRIVGVSPDRDVPASLREKNKTRDSRVIRQMTDEFERRIKRLNAEDALAQDSLFD